jgi:hypothetical protein
MSLLMSGSKVSFASCEKGIVKFQALWRGFQARAAFKAILRDQAYREKVANEILSTEREYVSFLAKIIMVYLDPLVQAADLGKPIIKKDEIVAIFSNIRELHALHVALLNTIEERVGKGSWTISKRIADIFLKITELVVGPYSTYVSNWSKSSETLDALREGTKLKAFLTACKENYSKLPIDALLIMPVQRVPRYVLLLNEYAKHTPDTHPDKKELK